MFAPLFMDLMFSTDSSLLKRATTRALISAVLLLSLFVIFHYNASGIFGFRFSFALPALSDIGRRKQCNYSAGKWVHGGGTSYYTEACPFLDPGFRCHFNGRNDASYQHWRWKPESCTLPRLNARLMLEMSRNRRILFAGDSIGRNQWESLVCMLWAATAGNQSGVYEKNGKPISKHKGYLAMFFRDYNLTVEYYRAPFLVHIGRPPPHSPSAVRKAIHVDLPHWDSGKWVGADVIVFNAGHWWSRDKTIRNGNYFQIGEKVKMKMEVKEAYRRAIQTLMRWAFENLDPRKSFVFFRSYSRAHYSNGTWDAGGNCDAEIEPNAGGGKTRPEPWSNRVTSEVLRENEELNLGFINITYLTEQRADGHPSKHREPKTPAGSPQDCSHWCLPGVPDAWNEILFADLLSMGYGGRKI